MLLGAAALLTASGIAKAQSYGNQNQKLRMAEAAISQFYVDTVNESKLVEDAIRGMLEGLDPHSQYSNPEETRELNEPLAGNTYVLAPGSPNYILSLPLEVQKINFEIENFERVETIVNE